MHEASNNSTQQASASGRWFVVMVGILSFVAGALLARGLFPVEVARTVVVEKEKRVEIPVDRIVEKRVEVPVEKVVEKIAERRVELPVAAVEQVSATSSRRGLSESRTRSLRSAAPGLRLSVFRGSVIASLRRERLPFRVARSSRRR